VLQSPGTSLNDGLLGESEESPWPKKEEYLLKKGNGKLLSTGKGNLREGRGLKKIRNREAAGSRIPAGR